MDDEQEARPFFDSLLDEQRNEHIVSCAQEEIFILASK